MTSQTLTNPCKEFEMPKSPFVDFNMDDLLDRISKRLNLDETDNIPKTLLEIGHCRKMVIQYDNQRTYTVSNPYDISVIRNKSGLIDVRYWVDKTETLKKEYGFENVFEEAEHIVHNQRVNRVLIEYHQNEDDVKKQELYVFN